MARVQEPNALQRLKTLPELKSREFDVGTRKEAVILRPTGGDVVIYESGSVRVRFPDAPLADVRDLLVAVLTTVADLAEWDPSDEPITFDTDLIYHVIRDGDVLEFLRGFAKVEALHSQGIVSEENLHGIGLQFFLSRWDERKDRDLRISLEPLATDPTRKLYVHGSYRERDVRIADLADHLATLTDRAAMLFEAVLS
jgi:hypothetical protein